MAKQTHLAVHSNGNYYFRRRIPKDLLQQYHPVKEIKISLNTKDRRKAEPLARLEGIKLDQEFAEFRKRRQHLQATQILSDEDISRLTQFFTHEVLSGDDERRVDGELTDEYFERLSDIRYSLKRSYAEGSLTDFSYLVDHALKQQNLNIPKNSDSYKKLNLAFVEAGLASLNDLERRQRGEPVATPNPPAKVITTVSDLNHSTDSLEALRDYWLLQPAKKSGRKKSRTSIAEADTIIKKFKQLIGDLKPNEIKKEHVVLLKDKMLSWRFGSNH